MLDARRGPARCPGRSQGNPRQRRCSGFDFLGLLDCCQGLERVEPLPSRHESRGPATLPRYYRQQAWGDAVDSIALVEEQIKAGQKVVARLNAAGIPITAA